MPPKNMETRASKSNRTQNEDRRSESIVKRIPTQDVPSASEPAAPATKEPGVLRRMRSSFDLKVVSRHHEQITGDSHDASIQPSPTYMQRPLHSRVASAPEHGQEPSAADGTPVKNAPASSQSRFLTQQDMYDIMQKRSSDMNTKLEAEHAEEISHINMVHENEIERLKSAHAKKLHECEVKHKAEVALLKWKLAVWLRRQDENFHTATEEIGLDVKLRTSSDGSDWVNEILGQDQKLSDITSKLDDTLRMLHGLVDNPPVRVQGGPPSDQLRPEAPGAPRLTTASPDRRFLVGTGGISAPPPYQPVPSTPRYGPPVAIRQRDVLRHTSNAALGNTAPSSPDSDITVIGPDTPLPGERPPLHIPRSCSPGWI